MTDRRISDHTANTSIADGDLFEHVDISDTTDAATGTNKKVTGANVWAYILAKLLAADGSGSTIDADLLDGSEAAAFVTKALFDANTILTADSDNTPQALTVAEQRLVGRITGGVITALTAAQIRTLINVEDGATADMSAAEVLAALLTVDGSGSGLDADLLDGNSSAAFVLASSYTAADVLSKLLTVDGSGSGLDADLLDGSSSAAFLKLVAAGASVEDVGAIESNVNTVAASGSTETLDTSLYAVHDVTMDAGCTFTFSNPAPSGKNTTFTLILRGAQTPVFPAAVDWGDASAPTYTTPSVYTFTTVDAGTTWLGFQNAKAMG